MWNVASRFQKRKMILNESKTGRMQENTKQKVKKTKKRKGKEEFEVSILVELTWPQKKRKFFALSEVLGID